MAKQTSVQTYETIGSVSVHFILVYGLLMMISKCMISFVVDGTGPFTTKKSAPASASSQFDFPFEPHLSSTSPAFLAFILLSKSTDICTIGRLEACVALLFNWSTS